MKFESRTGMFWFADGKTSFGASGPSTNGMAGSGGARRGVIPRSNVATVGGDTGGEARTTGDGDVLAAGEAGIGGADWQPTRNARPKKRMVRMRGAM
jgi:hypothetical protein